MLGPDDALPCPPRRVVVAGVSGVGKTTLAAELGRRLALPHTEIDALFHGPRWVPREQFLDDVHALVGSPRWVTEYQYRLARPLLLERVELLVWLDLPFWTATLPRLLRRTLRRRIRHEVLWNGNVEPPLWHVVTAPDHVVRWAFGTRHRYRDTLPGTVAERPDLAVVRLRTAGEVSRWLAGPVHDLEVRAASD